LGLKNREAGDESSIGATTDASGFAEAEGVMKDTHPQAFDKAMRSHGVDPKLTALLKVVTAPWTGSPGVPFPIGPIRGVQANRGKLVNISKPASCAAGAWNFSCYTMPVVTSGRDGQEHNTTAGVNPVWPLSYQWTTSDVLGSTVKNSSILYRANTELLQNALVVGIAWQAGESIAVTDWHLLASDRFFMIQIPELMGDRASAVTGISLKVVNTTPELYKGGLVQAYRQPCPADDMAVHVQATFHPTISSGLVTDQLTAPFLAARPHILPPSAAGNSNVPTMQSSSGPASRGALAIVPIDYTVLPTRPNRNQLGSSIIFDPTTSLTTSSPETYHVAMMPGPRSPIAYTAGAGADFYTRYAFTKRVSEVRVGFDFSGLTEQTTLSMFCYISSLDIPTSPDDQLQPLAVDQDPLDLLKLQALTYASFNTPLWSESDANGFGDFLRGAAKALTGNNPLVRKVLSIASDIPGPVGRIATGVNTGMDMANTVFGQQDKGGPPSSESRPTSRAPRAEPRQESRGHVGRNVPSSRETSGRRGTDEVMVHRARDGSEEIRIPKNRL
jgi:hypothetical protein